MVDPETLQAMKELATDVVKILGPAGLAAYVALRAARSQLAVERLKLHDRDRTLAHRRLFAFAKRVENATFPMAEEKRADFMRIMRDEYRDRMQLDLIYFSDEAASILDHFDEMYTCMTRSELIGDTDWETFLDEQVFVDARKLAVLARKAMHDARAHAWHL